MNIRETYVTLGYVSFADIHSVHYRRTCSCPSTNLLNEYPRNLRDAWFRGYSFSRLADGHEDVHLDNASLLGSTVKRNHNMLSVANIKMFRT
jgi:hypothetical protein